MSTDVPLPSHPMDHIDEAFVTFTRDEMLAYGDARAAAAMAEVEALREALTELRDRIKDHPVYADLTEEEEIETGGDTAEFSYLARVADAALQEQKP